MSKAFLIFSGHNDRAVVALCRALAARRLPFFLVASSPLDPILQTSWAPHLALIRTDCQVDLPLFEEVRRATPEDINLVYCPTTEFINTFALENRKSLQDLGVNVMLPSADIYGQLTSKSKSAGLVKNICGLGSPLALDWSQATAPCVFKPIANISGGVVHYPILCFSDREVCDAIEQINSDEWFVQRYVEGQSHYLCGYLSSDGKYSAYWQTNLMQQPNGKSIVLARTGANPGLQEERFFRGLASRGYFGPIMMEIIEEASGRLNYIEINPRFWGPLQLAVDACPAMLNLYATDAGFFCSSALKASVDPIGEHWYAWSRGANAHRCHLYPAAATFSENEIKELLHRHDVYARDDSHKLYECL